LIKSDFQLESWNHNVRSQHESSIP
jgi:hypothetical protein